MRLLLLGAPGSGKGTQARRLSEHFGIEHLATGEMLRAEVAADSPIGRQVQDYLVAGDLVPDEVVEELVRDRVQSAAERGGYVLDGYPRTLHQAEAAFAWAKDAGVTVDSVVHLDVPEDELLRRLLGRAEGRADDRERTIRHRLEVYRQRTLPLLGYYADRGVLVHVDGTRPEDSVFTGVLDALHAQ
jgi:adenylate kinase